MGLAGGLGVMFLDGLAVRFSMGAFGLVLDPPVMLTGIAAGLFLGFFGTLPPAQRCLGMPITDSLNSH